MGKTKELFMKLREEDNNFLNAKYGEFFVLPREEDNNFLNEHIIICTLKPKEAVTTAPNINK